MERPKVSPEHESFWLLATQVLEGMLEGASHLRPVLRVVGNLLATRCDSELLNLFCQELRLPLSLLHLAKQMLESGSTRQVSVEPQADWGSLSPAVCLCCHMSLCPAGAGSQDQCLFQALLRRGKILARKNPAAVVSGWQADSCHFMFLSASCSSPGVSQC